METNTFELNFSELGGVNMRSIIQAFIDRGNELFRGVENDNLILNEDDNFDENLNAAMEISRREYEVEQQSFKSIIPMYKIKKVLGPCKKIKKDDSILDSNCCICMGEYKVGEFKRTLPCNHIFHKKCIDKWFSVYKKSMECALCKKDFSKGAKSD